MVLMLLIADGLFLIGVGLVYLFVMRRRAKVFVLVDHLAELARRSLPLATGLRQVAADLRGRLGVRLSRLARLLEDGKPLGEAMAAAPGAFPPAVQNLVLLGERSGNLAGVLEELRKTYARMTEIASRTIYYFLYPVFLTLCISIALGALQVGVVPKFAEIVRQMKVSTSTLEGWELLSMVNQAVFAGCLGLAAFILSGGGSTHFGRRAPRFLRGLLSRGALMVPIFARVVRDRACAQFALAAGLVVRAGGTLPEAVGAAAQAEGNVLLARRFARVAARVNEGERLSAAARAERAFGDEFLWFVQAGEASGSMAEHLREAAVHYDTRSRFAAQVAARTVVPFFVVLNGGLVLAACYLTFQPMRDILKGLTPW